MCRLFGFRSGEVAKVHDSLVTERNSLRVQSRTHKDGWGIASYARSGKLEVAHGLGAAHADPEFERVSGLLSANTVLAHVRLATVGEVTAVNSHPFIHGKWAFAHNGTLCRFAQHKAQIESKIDPAFLPLIRGETDSERGFYYFLTLLQQEPDSLGGIARALARTGQQLASMTPPQVETDKPSAFSALVTDGERMVALRLNRSLYFSERKPKEAAEAVRPFTGRKLAQIVISSEELEGESHWHEVPEQTLLGIDKDLTLHFWKQHELL